MTALRHGDVATGDSNRDEEQSRDARAFLVSCLRWEHRLAELRSEHERDSQMTNTTSNPEPEPELIRLTSDRTDLLYRGGRAPRGHPLR